MSEEQSQPKSGVLTAEQLAVANPHSFSVNGEIVGDNDSSRDQDGTWRYHSPAVR